MIGLNLELLGQLAIDRLDNVAHMIDQLPRHSWELGLRIRARQRQQANLALFRDCRVNPGVMTIIERQNIIDPRRCAIGGQFYCN
jgi:hypothetical protein